MARPSAVGPARASAPSLSALDRVELTAHNVARLEAAVAKAAGPPPWRRRKEAEARDLLALAQIAPRDRMQIKMLDLSESLRVLLLLSVPVPLRSRDGGGLALADRALLGITYRLDSLVRPLPGTAFVQILAPAGTWHPNVAAIPPQPLCLGPQLPPGIRLTELVLLSYGAISMQTVMLDELDPAGVLNGEAARWWQQNTHRLPLTATPFLRSETEERT